MSRQSRDSSAGRVRREPISMPRFGLKPDRPIVAHVARSLGRLQFGSDLHLACELGIVIAGAMGRNHGTGWFHVRAGQAYACASFQPHQWRHPAQGLERIVFVFLPSLFQQMPNLAGFDPLVPFRAPWRYGPIGRSIPFRRRLAALGRELAMQYEAAPAGPLPGPLCLDLLRVLRLIGETCQSGQQLQREPRAHLFAASRINPALDLLRDRLERPPTLGEAAAACRMARSTFVKLFKEVTGLGFAQFALRWRLSGAAHVLRTTDQPIKAVAQQFGFRYRTYFSRVFASHYGVPPGRYRSWRE